MPGRGLCRRHLSWGALEVALGVAGSTEGRAGLCDVTGATGAAGAVGAAQCCHSTETPHISNYTPIQHNTHINYNFVLLTSYYNT